MRKKYDVAIVGAGPAGLFAAYELSQKNKVLVIDRGNSVKKRHCPMTTGTNECANCSTCAIMCGIGGSGTFSDGTLNLRPDVGGDLVAQTGDVRIAYELIDRIDKLFVTFGANKKLMMPESNLVQKLKNKAARVGAEFIEITQRHIGSSNAPRVINNFEQYLKKQGVDFMLQTSVADLEIDKNICKNLLMENDTKVQADNFILAPGRVGTDWLNKIAVKHNIANEHGYIDLGVRVEVPKVVMDEVTAINRDPKFHIYTKTYDDFIRTFCTNEHGYVVKESYSGFIATNGHSPGKKSLESQNTNFAFLVRIELTEPMENTTKYGKSIAKLATTIGGGKPILQRMGDLRRGRRTTVDRLKRNLVKNTLKDVTCGDISMALPHRIVTDIIEGLDTLDRIIPGVAADSTLLYAPEIKFYSTRITVDKNMKSSVKNIFVAGDGAGQSRDIVNAAATGILAANGILNKIL
jgi:uncharacterized protein